MWHRVVALTPGPCLAAPTCCSREDARTRWESTRKELTEEFKRKHKSASRRVSRIKQRRAGSGKVR